MEGKKMNCSVYDEKWWVFCRCVSPGNLVIGQKPNEDILTDMDWDT